jgi:hypothetical protein
MLVFCCRVFMLQAQIQEEPDFPGCQDGYDLIGNFEGELFANIPANSDAVMSITEGFTLTCDADLDVRGFTKEGHPERDCNSVPVPYGCTQTQSLEEYDVDIDGDIIGGYTDKNGVGGQNAWFDAGPWSKNAVSEGGHNMTFTHRHATLDVGVQSVDYKVSLCAKCEEERGGEGCTPGYWKQEQHFGSWDDAYDPGDLFSDPALFDRTITIRLQNGGALKKLKKITKAPPASKQNPTLLEALQAKGGCINALARHAVAALLNAASSNVNYLYTVAEVIAMTQSAIDSADCDTIEDTKDLFDAANNDEGGCPLNGSSPEDFFEAKLPGKTDIVPFKGG